MTNDWLDNEDISMLLMLVSSNNEVFDNYKGGKKYQELLKETLIRMRYKLNAEGYPKNDVFKAWR
jgi:hypothetical protein